MYMHLLKSFLAKYSQNSGLLELTKKSESGGAVAATAIGDPCLALPSKLETYHDPPLELQADSLIFPSVS